MPAVIRSRGWHEERADARALAAQLLDALGVLAGGVDHGLGVDVCERVAALDVDADHAHLTVLGLNAQPFDARAEHDADVR